MTGSCAGTSARVCRFPVAAVCSRWSYGLLRRCPRTRPGSRDGRTSPRAEATARSATARVGGWLAAAGAAPRAGSVRSRSGRPSRWCGVRAAGHRGGRTSSGAGQTARSIMDGGGMRGSAECDSSMAHFPCPVACSASIAGQQGGQGSYGVRVTRGTDVTFGSYGQPRPVRTGTFAVRHGARGAG